MCNIVLEGCTRNNPFVEQHSAKENALHLPERWPTINRAEGILQFQRQRKNSDSRLTSLGKYSTRRDTENKGWEYISLIQSYEPKTSKRSILSVLEKKNHLKDTDSCSHWSLKKMNKFRWDWRFQQCKRKSRLRKMKSLRIWHSSLKISPCLY